MMILHYDLNPLDAAAMGFVGALIVGAILNGSDG